MGLKLALKYHQEGDLANAEVHYKRALEQKTYGPALFQNYGALLREAGRLEESRSIYDKGLEIYPDSLDILRNKANLDLSTNPYKALEAYLYIFRTRLSSEFDSTTLQTSFLSCLSCLTELKLYFLAYMFLKTYGSYVDFNAQIILNILQIFYQPSIKNSIRIDCSVIDSLFKFIDSKISSYPLHEQVELRFGIARALMDQSQHNDAFSQYQKGMNIVNHIESLTSEDQLKVQKSLAIYAWNFSNSLIKKQEFSLGWSLYDYGLLTPADGKQRWQRALSKPFSNSELPLWSGNDLDGKSILLLEEQGIGDAMQFISLVPKLFDRAQHVGLFLSKRLIPIYQHSFDKEIESGALRLHTYEDAINSILKSSDYDYQLPLGSLPNFLFSHPIDFHPRVPILKSQSSKAQYVRSEYLQQFPGTKKIVGISWRGGGRADRIKKKSLDERLFRSILDRHPDIIFVSLQYGENGSTISRWRNESPDLKILFDKRFDPLSDMNKWLIQVSACDAVLSVANTTIHGSGGLNIPTYCLLSKFADWRWLEHPSVTRSFWYPSVGIARQNHLNSDWSPAINQVHDWFNSDCPMPDGSYFIQD